jgi:hypothetical protein
VGAIYSLGSESHECKTVHAEDVKLDGISLATTLEGRQGSIDAIDFSRYIPQTEKVVDFPVDKLTLPVTAQN